MIMTNPEEKPLAWLGSSKKDLMALPMGVRKFFGHALDFAQRGERHDAAKVLKGFGARVYWRSWIMTRAARIWEIVIKLGLGREDFKVDPYQESVIKI